MAERDVASIVWHEANQHIELTFVEGDVKDFAGGDRYAAELARMAGLHKVPGAHGTLRWVRDSDLWYGELPLSS